MTARLALGLSLAAVVSAVVTLILLGNKLTEVSRRVAALESRSLPAPPPPPLPEPPPESKETRQASERLKIKEMTDKESRDHLDILLDKLDLDAAGEAQVREAFAPEFDFFAEGVVRVFESLRAGSPQSDESWLESAEFRKGLEERIAAVDEKIRPLLDPARTAKFDEWRKGFRQSRYELD